MKSRRRRCVSSTLRHTSMAKLSRRAFLNTTSAAATVSALTLPAAAQPAGANGRLRVGLLGTGGRCRHLMPSLAKVANVRITALCDVYEPNRDLALKLGLADRSPLLTGDYREVLASKEV